MIDALRNRLRDCPRYSIERSKGSMKQTHMARGYSAGNIIDVLNKIGEGDQGEFEILLRVFFFFCLWWDFLLYSC